MEFPQFWVLTSLGLQTGLQTGLLTMAVMSAGSKLTGWKLRFAVFQTLFDVRHARWRWICHIGCVDGVFWEFCTFLRSLRRLNASVETVSGAISAVSTVQSANFTIFHFCRVWKKVVFCVKSWGTRKLYHVQEHTFGYLLSYFLSIFVKNRSF